MRPNGPTSSFATIGTRPGQPPLRDLNGIALARDGSTYFTENDALRRIDARGAVSTIAQNVMVDACKPVIGIGASRIPLLRGLAIDSTGSAYVAATGCSALVKVSPEGRVTTLYHSDGEWSPTGVALFNGAVYVLEFLGAGSDDRSSMVPRVVKIEANGSKRVLVTVRR